MDTFGGRLVRMCQSHMIDFMTFILLNIDFLVNFSDFFQFLFYCKFVYEAVLFDSLTS